MKSDRFATKLRALRAELLERHQRLDEHIHHRDGPVSADFEEQATERHDDEVVAALDDGVKAELGAIDAALSRIENGHFGICAGCGSEIEIPRLEAVPFATACTACMEKD